MGMLLFASLKTGRSPYLPVLKFYKTAGSNQWLKPPGLSWSCLFTTSCCCPWTTLRVFARSGQSFYKVRTGSLQGASFPGGTSGAWSESPHFLFPLLPDLSTSTLLLKPATPVGLGQCQTDCLRTAHEILRTVRVDTDHLPSLLLHFCVCLQPCFFLLVPVIFKCIHSVEFFRDIWPWQYCTQVPQTNAFSRNIFLYHPFNTWPFHKLQCLFSNSFPLHILQHTAPWSNSKMHIPIS